MNTTPFASFATLSDSEWRAVLMESITTPTVRGVRMPSFPKDTTQVLFTSHKNEAALDEAIRFRELVRRAGTEYGLGWGPDTKLLDFGVGWGRISRTFLKDVAPENLHGVDVNADILKTCKELMPYGTYTQCHNGKPLAYPAKSFDVIVAFSVFSHLSEKNHLAWLEQFLRVLKPGGIAVFTTLSRRFLRLCEGARAHPEGGLFHQQVADCAAQGRIAGLTGSFLDFPANRFLYLPTGGGIAGTEEEHYGWAMISPEYARRKWAPLCEICEYADVLGPLDQAVFVVRKRRHGRVLSAIKERAPGAWRGLRAVRKQAGKLLRG